MSKQKQNPLLPYENKWVAITPDRKKVVAHATTIKALSNKLDKLKNRDAILTKVLPFDGYYAP